MATKKKTKKKTSKKTAPKPAEPKKKAEHYKDIPTKQATDEADARRQCERQGYTVHRVGRVELVKATKKKPAVEAFRVWCDRPA